MKRSVILLVTLVIYSVNLLAQKEEKPIEKVEHSMAKKFPASRLLNVEYEMLSPSDYNSEIYEERYETGRIKNISRYKIAFSYPINVTRRLSITPNAKYKFETFELGNMENNSINYPTLYHNDKIETHFIEASVKATYVSQLFNKPMIYNFNLFLNTSDQGYEHMAANLVGLMVLNKTASSTFTLGLVATFDKTSLLPVFPLISYEHKFHNSPWSFDMFFPKYIYMKRGISTHGRLSLGTELSKNRHFGHPNVTGLEKSYNVVKRELMTGFLYEHYLNRHFILNAKGGLVNTLDWAVRAKSSRDNIINYSPNMNFYFNVGFSYNL